MYNLLYHCERYRASRVVLYNTQLCVFSHRAPLRSFLPLAADLQLTGRLGHWSIRRATQLWCHCNWDLSPVGMDVSDLATDDLALLSAGSTPSAALWPLPNVPAVNQSQRTMRELEEIKSSLIHHNRCGFMVIHELSNNLPQAEFVPTFCPDVDHSYCVWSVDPGPQGAILKPQFPPKVEHKRSKQKQPICAAELQMFLLLVLLLKFQFCNLLLLLHSQ